jgi:hypothetical protein
MNVDIITVPRADFPTGGLRYEHFHDAEMHSFVDAELFYFVFPSSASGDAAKRLPESATVHRGFYYDGSAAPSKNGIVFNQYITEKLND